MVLSLKHVKHCKVIRGRTWLVERSKALSTYLFMFRSIGQYFVTDVMNVFVLSLYARC